MQQYLDLLQNVLENGFIKGDRTKTGMIELFGPQMEFDLSKGFPLVTTKKMFLKGITHELLWFLKGDTNIKYLNDNGVHIWDAWAGENGDLNNVYGAQWRRWEKYGKEIELIKVRKNTKYKDEPFIAPKTNFIDISTLPDDSFTGLEFASKKSGKFVVLDKVGNKNKNSIYRVQFLDTGSIVCATRPNIRSGAIKDPYYLSVFSVGCLGSNISQKRTYHTRAYNMWQAMMARCYNKSHPSYHQYGEKGVFVDSSWKCFYNFISDLSTLPFFQKWVENPGLYHLDKDYYSSNIYSKKTCIFLSRDENHLYSQNMPIEVCEGGKSKIFLSQKEFSESYGIDSRRVSEQISGIRYFDRSLEIRPYQTPEGYVLRYKRSIDQIANLIEEIKTNANSRRMTVVAWNPADIPKMALPPCHCLFQFNVQDGKLNCKLYQRSADMFLGVPFNIASYAMLTMMIAQVCDLEPGRFIHTFGSAHIYQNHVDQVKLQLSRKPHPLPTMKINKDIMNIDDFKYEDFELVDYQHEDGIKAPIAV